MKTLEELGYKETINDDEGLLFENGGHNISISRIDKEYAVCFAYDTGAVSSKELHQAIQLKMEELKLW